MATDCSDTQGISLEHGLKEHIMNRSRVGFPVAVAATSLALVVIILGAGGLLVGRALADSPIFGTVLGAGGAWSSSTSRGGPPWTGHAAGWQLPPELAGLADVPAGERFSHFRGVQIQLTDKNNQPLTADITPGTATAASPTSLTIAANDGSSRTVTLDANTAIHGRRAEQNTQSSPSSIVPNDKVVVVTLNKSTTATAVMILGPDGFGPRGPFGH
jgi:hypothetical protein